MVPASLFFIPLIALVGAACGIWLARLHSLTQRLVPFGGGVLVGVGLVWVLPELAEYYGWAGSIAVLCCGLLLLLLVDRYVYPVCPACAPQHDHDHCQTRLHGFATPLFIAAALHSALDGWSVMTAGPNAGFGSVVFAGLAVHKLPEGIALGLIARSALSARSSALVWCSLVQAATIVGAALEIVLSPYLGTQGVFALLALAGGSFLYLGGHAVHGELRRSGVGLAMLPALTGVAGLGALRLLLR